MVSLDAHTPNLIRHWRFVLYICEGIFLKMLHGILYIQIKVYNNITLITYILYYVHIIS